MRLGLSSFIYRYHTRVLEPPITPTDILRRAGSLGCDMVQFCENSPLHLLSEGELIELKATSAETGVALEVGTHGVDPDLLHRYVALGERFGSRHLRLVPGVSDRDVILKTLTTLVPHLHAAGITLAIENHADLPAPEMAALVDEIGAPEIMFCLDTANNCNLLERPEETTAALASRTCQVHLKDYVVEPITIGHHITGTILGKGRLDAPAVLALLGDKVSELDYYIETWMDPAENLQASLAKEERWIAECLQAAKSLLSSSPIACHDGGTP